MLEVFSFSSSFALLSIQVVSIFIYGSSYFLVHIVVGGFGGKPLINAYGRAPHTGNNNYWREAKRQRSRTNEIQSDQKFSLETKVNQSKIYSGLTTIQKYIAGSEFSV